MNISTIKNKIRHYIEKDCVEFSKYNLGKEWSSFVEENVFAEYLYPLEQFEALVIDSDPNKYDNIEVSLYKIDPKIYESTNWSWARIRFNCIPYTSWIDYKTADWPFDNNLGRRYVAGRENLGSYALFADIKLSDKVLKALKNTQFRDDLLKLFTVGESLINIISNAREKEDLISLNTPIINQFFNEKGIFKDNFNPDPIDLRDVNI